MYSLPLGSLITLIHYLSMFHLLKSLILSYLFVGRLKILSKDMVDRGGRKFYSTEKRRRSSVFCAVPG